MAGTNQITITAYDAQGVPTSETYSDVLVGSLGTPSNYSETTTNYNYVPTFAKPEAYYIQRHNLLHAWRYTTGSKSVKLAMMNISSSDSYLLREGAATVAPDYTYDCDANTTAIHYQQDTSHTSHGTFVYSLLTSIAPDCYLAVLQSVEPAARIAKAIEIGAHIITDSDGTNTDGADAAGQASLTSFVNAATSAATAGILYFMATDDNAGYNPMYPNQMYYPAENTSYTGAMSWAATAPGVQQVSHSGGQAPYTYDSPWITDTWDANHTTPITLGSIPAPQICGYGAGIPFVSPGEGVYGDSAMGMKYDQNYGTLVDTQFGGTSFSTPVTAVCSALVKSIAPATSKDLLLGILNSTKSKIHHPDAAAVFPNAGFIDAGHGVKKALSTLPENAGVIFPYLGVTGPEVSVVYAGNAATTKVKGSAVYITVAGYCDSVAVESVELWIGDKQVYRGLSGLDLKFDNVAEGTNPLTIVASTATGTVKETYYDVQVSDLPVVVLIPTITSFDLPASGASKTVSINTLTATDYVGVTGWMITESATPPLASDPGWLSVKPTTYTFSTWGAVTAYAWAKNATGGVSASLSDTITLTQPAPTAPTWGTITAGPGSLSLQWNAGANADSYNVYYSWSSGLNDTTYNGSLPYPSTLNSDVGKITGISAANLAYVISGLKAQQYFVKVGAANSLGTALSSTYNITALAPPAVTITPAPGTYTAAQTITITRANYSGGAIYYTLDGSTPTTASTPYAGPITVSSSATLKVLPVDSGGNQGAVQTADYKIYVLFFSAQPSIYSVAADGGVVTYGTMDAAADDPYTTAEVVATATSAATFRDAAAAIISAGVSESDVNIMIESLTASASVTTTVTATLQSVESAIAQIAAFPTVSDLLTLAQVVTAPFAWSAQPSLSSGTADGGVVAYGTYDTGFDDVATSADISVAIQDVVARIEQALTTIQAVPTVSDLLAQVESITTTAQADATAVDVKVSGLADALLSAAEAVSTVSDMLLMVNGVTTLAESGASADTIAQFLENVATAATARASVVDVVGMLFGPHEVVMLLSPVMQQMIVLSQITRKAELVGTTGVI